jgi:hypothetical protein
MDLLSLARADRIIPFENFADAFELFEQKQ